ncbi:hypothetical protein WBO52_04550, partial [Saccharothrix sp. CCNWLW140]|uniref:hypothetical protein n=1 Tax=Saccharothrix sp. CCNWLW140 TaxID=3128895 RepID=UPI00307F9C8E
MSNEIPNPFEPAFFVPRPWVDEIFSRWLTSDSASRVMVVTGPPGTGKSRLLHAWSLKADAEDDTDVAATVLRDPRSRKIDEFTWSTLRRSLLSRVPPGKTKKKKNHPPPISSLLSPP